MNAETKKPQEDLMGQTVAEAEIEVRESRLHHRHVMEPIRISDIAEPSRVEDIIYGFKWKDTSNPRVMITIFGTRRPPTGELCSRLSQQTMCLFEQAGTRSVGTVGHPSRVCLLVPILSLSRRSRTRINSLHVHIQVERL